MSTEKPPAPSRQRPANISPGRPPQATLAARTRHLLSVAGAEFVTRGFAEASVSRIARDAGMSKKTIYARFPTKDALLLAVLEDYISGAREAVLDGMPTMTGEPAQVLTRYGMQIARDWTSPRVVAMYRLIISEVVRFPQLAEIFTSTTEVIRSTLTTYLREQATAGTVAITDPEAASRQFGMLAYGELRERTMLGETITEERLTATVERAVTLFLNGYAVGAPRQPSPALDRT
ncbi:TetR/AcrR family transcriptional regulator [Streptomyces sp. NPDC051320]|uniref:TetR/AcrR family transcriptional regulator n=1 Tax=Streptomyces sp. NPDC051320 TaxID=3154644 RepID=UPI00342E67D6